MKAPGRYLLVGAVPRPAAWRDEGADGLHNGNGVLLATNDDWEDGPDQGAISNQGLAPSDDKESALLSTLPAGAYTAIVRGVNSATGIALVEVYGVP